MVTKGIIGNFSVNIWGQVSSNCMCDRNIGNLKLVIAIFMKNPKWLLFPWKPKKIF